MARTFAADLRLVDDAELTAIGSRRQSAAQAFASEFGVRRAYGSYAGVVTDSDVDVVYVATPHGRHFDDVMLCFEAGKPVLCEKALTLDAGSTAELIAESRRRGLFLMEAMWMRTNPNIKAMQEIVASGLIGEVGSIGADFGMVVADLAKARLVDPELGASAVLDIGVYPLTFAWLFLGAPMTVQSAGTLSPFGTDDACASVLGYANGATATLACSNLAATPGIAHVGGTKGHIEVPAPFWAPHRFTVASTAGPEVHEHSIRGRGYTHEIEEVHRCLRAGLLESDVIPLDDTLGLMLLMDQIRAQIGVVPRHG
ncbi:MAG: Gfo/Idh/MocA family oxidoreductase [Propionibacteriales bacterium]|nr:Gfo/Idh/MocA family oxidoreductase [Propionibacteriales bacterium]